jgi:hypothetical protein
MKKSIVYLALVFTFFAEIAYAQRVLKVDSTNTTKMNVFDSHQYFDENPAGSFKNVIKINPLLIMFGEIPIYYERKITKKLSAEIALGVTLRNYFLDFNLEDDYSGDVYKENQKTNTSFSYRAALRLYPSSSEEAVIGYYFSPEFLYRKYVISYPYLDMNQNPTDIYYDGYTVQSDFKLVFGYQDYIDNNIIFDYYIGVGMRQQARKHLSTEEFYDSNSGSYQYYSEIKSASKSVPTISMGLKVGFGF